MEEQRTDSQSESENFACCLLGVPAALRFPCDHLVALHDCIQMYMIEQKNFGKRLSNPVTYSNEPSGTVSGELGQVDEHTPVRFMFIVYTTLDTIRTGGHSAKHFEKALHPRVGARASVSAMVPVQSQDQTSRFLCCTVGGSLPCDY